MIAAQEGPIHRVRAKPLRCRLALENVDISTGEKLQTIHSRAAINAAADSVTHSLVCPCPSLMRVEVEVGRIFRSQAR